MPAPLLRWRDVVGDQAANSAIAAPLPRGVHERIVSHRIVPTTMHSNDLQIVRWRRRAQAPAPACQRTGVRLAGFSPARLCGRRHTGPVSHHEAEQGSRPVGDSTTPPHQRRREAAWWDDPGPVLSRGPSLDGLKTRCYGVNGRWIVAGRRSGAATIHHTVRSSTT